MNRSAFSPLLGVLATALSLSFGSAIARNPDVPAQMSNKDNILVTHQNGEISLIQRASPAGQYVEVERVEAGLISPQWPANQYVGSTHWWWVGQTNGTVRGMEFRREDMLQAMVDMPDRNVTVDTYITPDRPNVGANFAGVTPNGKTVWNAAREVDEIQEIDADPNSPTFGQILTRISVTPSIMAGNPTAAIGAMRPCDMSISPNGQFLFEPDLAGETVTAVDIRTKQIAHQLLLAPVVPGTRVAPFMLTTNGKIALVENNEGTYAVIDVSNPYNMIEIKRLTRDDGVGVSPQTSEFTPDGKYAFLIANGSVSVPGVISVLDLATLTINRQIQLPQGCRPHAGDFSRDGRHFFVNCANAQSLAVIDTQSQALVQNVQFAGNPTPRGVLVR